MSDSPMTLITKIYDLDMPINKNALVRYLTLDEKLRSSYKYTLSELAAACAEKLNIDHVSERTIKADLKFMRETLNAPIPRPTDGRYAYQNRQFSIQNAPLSTEEVSSLQSVLTLLRQFEYLPQFQDVQDLVLRLESKQSSVQSVIEFDVAPLKNLALLRQIYDSTVQKRPLLVHYTPFPKDVVDSIRFNADNDRTLSTFQFNFHPYFLKEFNNRWFVFGYIEEKQGVHCLALDRLSHLHPLSMRPFQPNTSVDFEHYFEDIIGVTHLSDYPTVEDFILKFKKPRAYYVATKPWKNHQREVDQTENSITFAWRLRYNRELEARVLEFGADVEVLAPVWFRDKIKDILSAGLALYPNT